MRTLDVSKMSPVKLQYLQDCVRGEDVLDVGSGQGYYSQWIGERFAGARVVAVDHCMLDQKADHFTFVSADLEQGIPFADNSFSTIVAFDVIEHVAHVKQLVNEMYRVCKPGGVIIGSVPHDEDKFLPAYNLTFYHRSDITHKRYYRDQSLQHELESVGFKLAKLDKHGGVSPQVFAEFFPKPLHRVIKNIIGGMRRVGLVKSGLLYSDLFFVAYKP